MIFSNPVVCRITARFANRQNKVSVDGITLAESYTAEQAAEQINKIFNIVSDPIVADKNMRRTIVQEANS